jgi:HAD superfamily hydrolase (TIGR01662 family)
MTATHRLAAVLFDRDGTLVVDVPYCADPSRVQPVPAARPALRRLRAAGIRTGVVTNQSGIGRGILTDDAVAAVNAEVERLLGPFDVWRICPHAPEACCPCRKPRPDMLLDAAWELGLEPHRIAYVGDIGSDVEAAQAAGAASVLVPTSVTRPAEIRAAPVVRRTLTEAVDHLLDEVGDRTVCA